MWRHVWIRAFFLTFGLFLAIFSWQFFKFCWTWMRWDKGIYRTSIRFVVLSFTVYLRLSFLGKGTSTVVRTSKKIEILPIFCTAWWVFYCFDDGNIETSRQFIVTFSKLILVSLCGLVDLGHFQFSLWYFVRSWQTAKVFHWVSITSPFKVPASKRISVMYGSQRRK